MHYEKDGLDRCDRKNRSGLCKRGRAVEQSSTEKEKSQAFHRNGCLLYTSALLDIMLPKKNGIEVLKELRTFSELPVIMLTAVTDEETQVQTLSLIHI